MTPRLLDIHQRYRLARFTAPILTAVVLSGVAHDHHNVCVRGKRVDEGRELRIANVHALELGLCLAAAELELLHDIGYFLESMGIKLRGRGLSRVVVTSRRCPDRDRSVIVRVGRVGRYGSIPPGTRGQRRSVIIIEIRIIDRGGGHAVGGG